MTKKEEKKITKKEEEKKIIMKEEEEKKITKKEEKKITMTKKEEKKITKKKKEEEEKMITMTKKEEMKITKKKKEEEKKKIQEGQKKKNKQEDWGWREGGGSAKRGQQVTIEELGQPGQVHVHVLDQLQVRKVRGVFHLNQVNQPDHTHTHKWVSQSKTSWQNKQTNKQNLPETDKLISIINCWTNKKSQRNLSCSQGMLNNIH